MTGRRADAASSSAMDSSDCGTPVLGPSGSGVVATVTAMVVLHSRAPARRDVEPHVPGIATYEQSTSAPPRRQARAVPIAASVGKITLAYAGCGSRPVITARLPRA